MRSTDRNDGRGCLAGSSSTEASTLHHRSSRKRVEGHHHSCLSLSFSLSVCLGRQAGHQDNSSHSALTHHIALFSPSTSSSSPSPPNSSSLLSEHKHCIVISAAAAAAFRAEVAPAAAADQLSAEMIMVVVRQMVVS